MQHNTLGIRILDTGDRRESWSEQQARRASYDYS